MLRKPSNPSPYNAVLDKPTEDKPLTFTAACVGTSDIKGMRLSIKDDVYEYYLPVKNSDSCKTNSSITIPFDADTLDEATSYYIKTSNFTRTDGGITLNNIIKPLNRYRWQVRLYQDDVDINIAYGFVQEVYTYNSSGTDAFKRRKILKLRPHTNMFMSNAKSKLYKVDDDSNSHLRNNGWNKCQQLIQYYDDNVKYQIQFNGVVYDVKDYYYSKTNAYYDTAKKKYVDLSAEKQFDQPLYGYIEIDIEDGGTIEDGAEYTILTNYIDSNEYNFSCRELSEVTFKGRDGNPISEFTSIDKLDANPDEHIYKPKFSNVQIKGAFPTTSTAKINYYRATLYQVLSNGEDIQIHDSGYVYDSAIDYDCKDLLSGSTYKLVITVTDTYGNTTSKGVYIKPNYGAIVKPTQLSVEPYREHGSVILDFGKLLSISGHLSGDNLDDEGKGYQIGELTTVKGENSVFNVQKDETTISLLSTDTNTVEGTACYIYPNNTVSYNAIDNSDEYITCKDPLVNIVFRCNNSDTQTIFEFESSQKASYPIRISQYGTTVSFLAQGKVYYNLTWENYRFHLRIYIKSENGYMYGVGSHGTPLYRYPIVDYVDEYYTPYEIMDGSHSKNEIVSAIQSAISEKNINYSVPYLSYDNIKMDENSYVHTESAARDFWWHAVVTKNKLYIKCINPPNEYENLWQLQKPIGRSGLSNIASVNTATLTLYGGCAYYNVAIEDGYTSSKMTEDRIEELSDNPFVPLAWNDNSVLLANFKNGLEGGNYDGSYNNVNKFRIYKTHSNQPEMHKIYETNNANETIVEDFTVGSECDYTYYIVPVCQENGVETTGSIIKSDPITLHDGTVRVIGLKQDDTDLDTYYIDTNNVWNISFNISDTGFQNNMGKTYNDTPQRFPIEIKNKGFYRTFNINGLLGKFDCESIQYVDTYDDIIEWEKFVDNGEMKLVIDLRGIMTVGTMESNSIDYSEAGANMVSVNFSIRQLADINNITILNRNLLFNPTSGEALLMDANGLALQDKEDKYLIVNNGK